MTTVAMPLPTVALIITEDFQITTPFAIISSVLFTVLFGLICSGYLRI